MVELCSSICPICSPLLYRVCFGRAVALSAPVFLSQYVPEFLFLFFAPWAPLALYPLPRTYRYDLLGSQLPRLLTHRVTMPFVVYLVCS